MSANYINQQEEQFNNTVPEAKWNALEKNALRFFSTYLLLLIFPLNSSFYKQFFSINWLNPNYNDLFNLAHYTPQFITANSPYSDWFIAGILALAGTLVWRILEKRITNPLNYDALYYWLRVIVRYRLAIALLAYGFIKFFPLQFPYPSISNLNTKYGDYTDWKLFLLSIGIVPSYESFLGLIEILIAFLLLYRKTAAIGGFLAIFFLGNVFFSLLAYNGGETAYSLFLLSLALFVFAYDAKRLTNLVALELPAFPNKYHPVFKSGKIKYGRLILKSAVIVVFVIIYGFKTRSAYHYHSYPYPNKAGLSNAAGIYNVSEFRINNTPLPYANNDAVRWKDVVFEKWNTISIRSNRPVIIDSTNTDKITVSDNDKTAELQGSVSRHYYAYTIDSAKHTLTLHNRNKHYAGETLLLNYESLSDSTLRLSGLNENRDSVYAVLDKINKKYLLEETKKTGRRGNNGIKL